MASFSHFSFRANDLENECTKLESRSFEHEQPGKQIEYNVILEGKKKIMTIPIGDGINRENAFY